MAEFMRNQRVKSASFDLFSSLIFARSEAITRNATVRVEPVSGSWTNGWTVKDATGNVLRELGAVRDVAISLTPGTSIEYRGSGRLNAAAMPQFQLSSTGSTVLTRCIKIDLSGRPTTTTQPCT